MDAFILFCARDPFVWAVDAPKNSFSFFQDGGYVDMAFTRRLISCKYLLVKAMDI
jgi:hypothetical protein